MAKLGSTQVFGDLVVDGEIINKATTTTEGVVQLSSATNSTSTTLAATASAVKTAYDLAATKAPTTAVTTGANGLMIAADKSKLDGIATSANNYVHPANHPASVITQDPLNRFVTDTEKATWNAKLSATTLNASDVNYTNTSSDLTATKVQGAIDEISSKVGSANTVLVQVANNLLGM